MLGLRMRIGLFLTHEPDYPPSATTGLEGIREANRILSDYNVPGVLIGGLAKEIWQGNTSEEALAAHKDVDVLVLSFDCVHHPQQWEGGIDWWVAHSPEERPNNGGSVCLRWTMTALVQELEAGLYLCPVDLLERIMITERTIKDRKPQKLKSEVPCLNFNDIRLLPDYLVQACSFGDGSRTPKGRYCKHR
jgi:hypothetical protein